MTPQYHNHRPNLHRNLLLLALASLTLSALPAHAQDIAGTWQGTLQTSGHRLVLMISKSDGNTLSVCGEYAEGQRCKCEEQEIPVEIWSVVMILGRHGVESCIECSSFGSANLGLAFRRGR